jgi:hypothetical protein
MPEANESGSDPQRPNIVEQVAAVKQGLEKSRAGQFERSIPAAAEAAIDFAAVTARLKPCPFKADSN